MLDQATALRELVSRHTRQRAVPRPPRPRIVAVLGGQPEVGCSTVALNLAATVGTEGMRGLLIDGHSPRGGMDERWEQPPRGGWNDVLSGNKSLDEVVLRGPGGIRVVPGPAADGDAATAARRLPEECERLGEWAEWVVVDLGVASLEHLTAWTSQVDALLLVTTPEPSALLDTYATLKSLAALPAPPEPRLVVNQVRDERSAAIIHQRLDQSSRRFLGQAVILAAALPHDSRLAEREPRHPPPAMAEPESPLAKSLAGLLNSLPRPPAVASPP